MTVEFNDVESRKWLTDLLHNGQLVITFTKVDGSERSMRCSLREDLVEHYERKTDRQRVINNDVLPVFDLDKQEWRSFRWDSIKKVGGTLA